MNTVLIVVFAPITWLALVLGFGAVVHRLLGVRVGWFRLIVAGLVAAIVVSPISRALAPPSPAGTVTPIWFMLLALACAVLAAMVLLVVAEALVPSGSLGNPLQWVRGVRRWLNRTRRYYRIVSIAVRHGLGPYLSGRHRSGLSATEDRRRLARSLRHALDEGGVTFIKLGQVLATRRDVLPAEFVDELGRLQDQAAPAPWEQTTGVLTRELGASVDEVFAEFDRVPLATASVAQVHAATLRSGERVAVKVRRPGIDRVVERDLDIVGRLAKTLHARTRWGRSLGVLDLAAGFAEAIREELDFRVEAGNMAAVAAAAASDRGTRSDDTVRLPTPYLPLCGARVLVMQRLDGVPLAAADVPDPTALARTLLRWLLRQVMVDGVFHADPHPGNILVLPGGGIGVLDFGSVGRLDASRRGALQRLLVGMNRGDPLAVADALLEVVTRPDEIDQAQLERDLGQFLARHLGPGATPGVRMFTDLFRIVADHGLAIPSEVAAVFRALATLEGTLAGLAPGFDLVAEARAFGAAYLTEQLTPAAARQAAADEFAALLPMLRRLPRRVDRITAALESGRFGVHVHLLGTERERRHATELLHQGVLAFLGPAIAVVAVLLLGTPGGPAVTEEVGLYQLFGYFLLVISSVLVLRVLVLIFRRER